GSTVAGKFAAHPLKAGPERPERRAGGQVRRVRGSREPNRERRFFLMDPLFTSGPHSGAASATSAVKAVVLESSDITRAMKRMAHEILERNHGADGLVLAGIRRRGVPLAERLGNEIERIEGVRPPVGSLDVSLYRDDIEIRQPADVGQTAMPFDPAGKIVVLVDDVLYTGRTVRAAIDALVDFGRPRAVQLAVLIH